MSLLSKTSPSPVYHAIAAMSKNRVIGASGRIPWHLPEDFRWFKHKTMGGTLIMGRKTFDSIGKPLPGRKTVVLSRTAPEIPHVAIYPHLETFRAAQSPEARIWICGGTDIYRQLLPDCSVLYLTRVKRVVEGDAFFPAFEDSFSRDQVIHETRDFQIERWINTRCAHPPEPESWPFTPVS